MQSKLISEIAEKLPGTHAESDTGRTIPQKSEVEALTEEIRRFYYPAVYGMPEPFERLADRLRTQIALTGKREESASLTLEFLRTLPEVKEMLDLDAKAIYEGDPAASSVEEVLLAYPGFFAITVYRLAHEMYRLGVPFIPRLMTEYAHEHTGIDIHAGASIGTSFCIDHGTGIVIGETTTIGDRVKIYQGVTLGAKSFSLDENGNPVKGVKRHPDIGSDVVIYANATILGGNTKVGDGSVIGGNVFLTNSVSAGTVLKFGK